MPHCASHHPGSSPSGTPAKTVATTTSTSPTSREKVLQTASSRCGERMTAGAAGSTAMPKAPESECIAGDRTRDYVGAMQFGLDISPAGEWGDPRGLAELAALAERSGWDGVFLEDYVFYPGDLAAYDPWVALAAIALVTERIRIGTMITPVPRRRPWKLAAEAMTIDHLSGGRLILG